MNLPSCQQAATSAQVQKCTAETNGGHGGIRTLEGP